MTNDSIKELIDQLNGVELDFPYVICNYQISDSVEYGKVWENMISEIKSDTQFFFIKNENRYVGAVNIHQTDLHWYVLEQERNKGYLTNALKTAIIPYLFQSNELEAIRITIDPNSEISNNHLASVRVAEKIGFRKITDEKYLLDKDLFDFSSTNISIKHPGIEDLDYEVLKSEIRNISARLHQIHTFFEFSSGLKMKDYQTPTIAELATTLNSRRWSLEDMYHDSLMCE
jgi:hypothetical protein